MGPKSFWGFWDQPRIVSRHYLSLILCQTITWRSPFIAWEGSILICIIWGYIITLNYFSSYAWMLRFRLAVQNIIPWDILLTVLLWLAELVTGLIKKVTNKVLQELQKEPICLKWKHPHNMSTNILTSPYQTARVSSWNNFQRIDDIKLHVNDSFAHSTYLFALSSSSQHADINHSSMNHCRKTRSVSM